MCKLDRYNKLNRFKIKKEKKTLCFRKKRGKNIDLQTKKHQNTTHTHIQSQKWKNSAKKQIISIVVRRKVPISRISQAIYILPTSIS